MPFAPLITGSPAAQDIVVGSTLLSLTRYSLFSFPKKSKRYDHRLFYALKALKLFLMEGNPIF